MRVGFALPTAGSQASVTAIRETVAAAAEEGWDSVWVVDHLLVGSAAAAERGRIFEGLMTLGAIAGGRHNFSIGVGVLVVPLRNAVVLAKELSTLQTWADGRLVLGVGVGWHRQEFANLGVEDRFASRGAYLDEAIRLWRHLWTGETSPFLGEFHHLSDFVFDPLPSHTIPIYVGGDSRAALVRACSLGDGYIASRIPRNKLQERLDALAEVALSQARPTPPVIVKLHLRDADGALRNYGVPDAEADVREAVRELVAAGVREVILDTPYHRSDEMIRSMHRFRLVVGTVTASVSS
jgi:alkanesulfonate monooxygenase SsuD/methylene tetrahydromethanopterin reductase-like flavin-dependent oxidoreductase (luciferase family)